jgi:hypothetical protein
MNIGAHNLSNAIGAAPDGRVIGAGLGSRVGSGRRNPKHLLAWRQLRESPDRRALPFSPSDFDTQDEVANGGFCSKETFRCAFLHDRVWSARAPQQVLRILIGERSADGQCGHRRTIMEMSVAELTATKRPVWNAGRTVGAKRALKPKQIWEIRFYLNQRRRLRDRALFDLAIDSKIRGCDLVQMKIGDLVSGGQIRTRAIVMQQKTGRPVQFELLPDARASLLAWLDRRGGTVDDYVFPSRVDHNGHLSTRQYARLVDEWVTGVGLMRSEYGTHSLRRTKASIIYRATGNLRAVQILLRHSKIENTVRYLGIDVEDALALAENTEI